MVVLFWERVRLGVEFSRERILLWDWREMRMVLVEVM